MKTPIQELLTKVKQFESDREILLPFLLSNRMKFQDEEKEFIKMIYQEGLCDTNLTKKEKEAKAEEYYIKNFENGRL